MEEIKGLRNVLAHQYDELDLRQLWRAAVKYSPELLPKLDDLLPPMEGE